MSCLCIDIVEYFSIKDEVGSRAHGRGAASGARVEHDAPHVRARAVGAAPRRAAGVAHQRAGRARRHAGRHRAPAALGPSYIILAN